MREILFKAKRKHGEEWVKGYYIGCIAGCYFLLTQDREEVLIDVETLSQYTGLKDVSGVKIFENDVVRHFYKNIYGNEEKGVVHWCDENCQWRRSTNNVTHRGDVSTYRMSPDCRYEVIGNRFDNPELLHGKG